MKLSSSIPHERYLHSSNYTEGSLKLLVKESTPR